MCTEAKAGESALNVGIAYSFVSRPILARIAALTFCIYNVRIMNVLKTMSLQVVNWDRIGTIPAVAEGGGVELMEVVS